MSTTTRKKGGRRHNTQAVLMRREDSEVRRTLRDLERRVLRHEVSWCDVKYFITTELPKKARQRYLDMTS